MKWFQPLIPARCSGALHVSCEGFDGEPGSLGTARSCTGQEDAGQDQAQGKETAAWTNTFYLAIKSYTPPHSFCYFIESGRSLSMLLKTKTIVVSNTGQSLWGLFPLKILLITLQCMWVITQGTLLTQLATVMNSNFKAAGALSARLQPLPSTQ